VEQTVTTPIEIQVNGVPGMNYLQSKQRQNDGRSTMNVYLIIGTNVDIATTEVQNRVNIATPILPDEVKRLGITVRRRNQATSQCSFTLRKEPIAFSFSIIIQTYLSWDALLRVKGCR